MQNQIFYKRLARCVDQLRIKKQLTQDELAATLNFPRSSTARWLKSVIPAEHAPSAVCWISAQLHCDRDTIQKSLSSELRSIRLPALLELLTTTLVRINAQNATDLSGQLCEYTTAEQSVLLAPDFPPFFLLTDEVRELVLESLVKKAVLRADIASFQLALYSEMHADLLESSDSCAPHQVIFGPAVLRSVVSGRWPFDLCSEDDRDQLIECWIEDFTATRRITFHFLPWHSTSVVSPILNHFKDSLIVSLSASGRFWKGLSSGELFQIGDSFFDPPIHGNWFAWHQQVLRHALSIAQPADAHPDDRISILKSCLSPHSWWRRAKAAKLCRSSAI